MKSYSARKVFAPRELRLLARAERLVACAPGKLHGEYVRCHELARAVGRILGLPVADGWYGFVEHSWLWTKQPDLVDGPLGLLPNILDVYVPGRVPQVELVHVSAGCLLSAYRPNRPREDIDLELVNELVSLCRSGRKRS